MSGTWIVVCECEGDKLKPYSIELAAAAVPLAKAAGASVRAVVVGTAYATALHNLSAYGVTNGIVVDAPALNAGYNSDGMTNVLTQLIQTVAPTVVLGNATPLGKDALPRVAMRLGTGIVADTVALRSDGDRLVATHPVYAGKAMVDAVVRGTPQMVLVRPNALGQPTPGAAGTMEVQTITADAGTMRMQVKEVQSAPLADVDLTEANIIVSGGRALGSSENFRYIRELAQAIGGSVGASRAAVDAGYIGHDHQVGQTGKTVNPTLYIACGISGAIQHLAGMRTSRFIVAINKDPDAPIFSKADFGIVGDLFQIVPVLAQKIRQVKSA